MLPDKKQSPSPFPDNMIQGVNGPVLLQPLHSGLLVLVEGFLQTSHEHPELTELVQQRLVSQEGYVFGIVIGLVCRAALVHLLDALRLVRVYPFQYA